KYRERRHRHDVEENVRCFGHWPDLERNPDQQTLQCAWNFALGPHDVGTEIGPRAGRVVSETHQEDLRFVLEEQFSRQAVSQTKGKEGDDGNRPPQLGERPHCWPVRHRVYSASPVRRAISKSKKGGDCSPP